MRPYSVKCLDCLLRHYRRHGIKVRAVLSDNGPEYNASAFSVAVVAKGLSHVRIPPRSPNHNAVVERFHETILQECWRPAFHRRCFTNVASSKPKPTPIRSPTTVAAATTATTCGAAPLKRS